MHISCTWQGLSSAWCALGPRMTEAPATTESQLSQKELSQKELSQKGRPVRAVSSRERGRGRGRALSRRAGLFLLLGLVGAAAFVVVSGRLALAQQNQPLISVTCPTSVPSAVRYPANVGSVECTFTASWAPSAPIAIRYGVGADGGRGLSYQQQVNTSTRVSTDRILYHHGTSSITVTLQAGSGYRLGSPSTATITIGPQLPSPTRLGVNVNESGAFDGYLLLTSAYHNRFYLIDNQGREAYRWERTGGLGVLLDNGNVLTGDDFTDVAEIKPDGTDAYTYTGGHQHHEVLKLSNGNYMFLVSEFYSREQSIAAGANPACLESEGLEADAVVEVSPSGTSGGTIIWKWSVWDHLIQDHDATKANYGVVADHPERIDINYGICQLNRSRNSYIRNPHHLTHLNAIDYNPTLNQILITSRHFSEAWIIDRSTTTAQAATSTGGNSGMGGDLLYRYGNPRTYQNGTKADQTLFFPHAGHWIPSGLPGAGNILIYNNGHEHPGFLRPYASVDELVFPASGYKYLRAGTPYMAPTIVWTHQLPASTWVMSNTQRLPNGNTLITEGAFGRISEVTQDNRVVWHYVSPLVAGTEVLTGQDTPATPNAVWIYRTYKYATDHPGIQALSLTAESERTRIEQGPCVVTATSADLVTLVRSYHESNKSRAGYDQNWFRVLIAFGAETSDTLEPFTVAEARQEEQIWSGWQPVREELERLETEAANCEGGGDTSSSTEPSVSVSGGSAVTEGAAATFTVTASPAPSAAITVNVTVSSVGGFAAAATRTVTIPTAGSATLSVATTGDSVDEPDGSVTVTVTTGTGYTVGSSSTATVAVRDDDEPVPSVSVSGGGAVTEGAAATFTVTASPAPSAAITVNVTVSSVGGFAAAATRTVTIPTAGSATLSVATTGDSVDEPDGSVTVTVTTGTGYTVGSSSTATVAVRDDDDTNNDDTDNDDTDNDDTDIDDTNNDDTGNDDDTNNDDDTGTAPPEASEEAADVSFVAPAGGTSASLNGRGPYLAVVGFAPGAPVAPLRLPGACNTVGAVTYRLVDFSTGQPLGGGLSFDAATRTISGTPAAFTSAILKLVATDSGGTADARANRAEFVFRLRVYSSYSTHTNTSVDCTTGPASANAYSYPSGYSYPSYELTRDTGAGGGHVPRLKPGTIQTLFAPNTAATGSPAYRYMNDHTVYRDTNGKWHVIGVANNRVPSGTTGEYQFAHGTADSLLGPYTRKPDIDPNGSTTWAFAPHAITFNGQAYMFYGPKDWGLATSSDLETWTNQTLSVTYPAHDRITDPTTPRDAMVLKDGGTYYKYVTSVDPSAGNQNVVDVLQSTDLINWTYVDHALTLSGSVVKTAWSTAESPFVVKYSDLYYLFVTITNTNTNNDNYHQTLVFRSDSPTDFGDFNGDKVDPQGAHLVTELPVHAPEVVLDPSTNKWYITTAGWDSRQRYPQAADGVAIIEMEWVAAPADVTPISNAGWTLHHVSSQNRNHPAAFAFDRNPTTYWESGDGGQPHTLDINLGATYDLNGLVYVPEPHGGSGGVHGVITGYRLYVSADGTDWGDPVASGSFDNSIIDNNARKLVTFSTKRGRYIRFVSTAAVGGNVSRVQDLGVLGVSSREAVGA